jgi:site-specific recombinase XerD
MSATDTRIHKIDFPVLVERYFCQYLLKQRNASPETISSYRDTFRLFLRFSEQCFRKAPATLTLAELQRHAGELAQRPEDAWYYSKTLWGRR